MSELQRTVEYFAVDPPLNEPKGTSNMFGPQNLQSNRYVRILIPFSGNGPTPATDEATFRFSKQLLEQASWRLQAANDVLGAAIKCIASPLEQEVAFGA